MLQQVPDCNPVRGTSRQETNSKKLGQISGHEHGVGDGLSPLPLPTSGLQHRMCQLKSTGFGGTKYSLFVSKFLLSTSTMMSLGCHTCASNLNTYRTLEKSRRTSVGRKGRLCGRIQQSAHGWREKRPQIVYSSGFSKMTWC